MAISGHNKWQIIIFQMPLRFLGHAVLLVRVNGTQTRRWMIVRQHHRARKNLKSTNDNSIYFTLFTWLLPHNLTQLASHAQLLCMWTVKVYMIEFNIRTISVAPSRANKLASSQPKPDLSDFNLKFNSLLSETHAR